MAAAGRTPHVVGAGHGTTEEDGYRAAADLLDEHPAITAIFAANDTMALGALAAAREHGRTVPADLSVIGYDNSSLARSRYLDLTSVDACNEAIGAGAARALLARIDDPTRQPERSLLQPSLVVRGTTAPLR